MLVKYFADIRRLAGREEEQRTRTAPTLGALLAELAAERGPAFRARVLDGDRLRSTMIVLVNGQSIEHLRGLETPLGPDDVVAVFPMVAGG